MEQRALNEAIALYQASVRRSPALMMETVNVDSNRGVTSRGNSPYDKFSSPETRAKVLESRMQEIAAFAQSRAIPASNLYALAEAAMRTGKIPDMGQFGLAGDDAVATKQFLISNVLNIAGLEWLDYKGDPVEEAWGKETDVDPREEGKYEGRSMESLKKEYESLKAGGPYTEGSEKFGKMKELAFAIRAKSGWGKVQEDDARQREVEAEAEERAARQKKIAARRAEGRTSGGYQMADTGVDPRRYMAEEGGPYRTGGAPERASLSPVRMTGGDVPSHPQNYEKKDLLPKGVMAKLKSQVGDKIYGMAREDLFRLARERGLLGTEEGLDGSDLQERSDTRSETDKILGIESGDPRSESWPKLGGEMQRLLNLESCGVFRGPRGLHMEEPEADGRIEEMTVSGGVGAFMGAGMLGGGMTGRTCAMPSYDASYELPEDPEKRVEMLKQMLSKHGLKKVQESDDFVPAPNSTVSPVVRSEDYDRHPSRAGVQEGVAMDPDTENEDPRQKRAWEKRVTPAPVGSPRRFMKR